ncbi:MAG: MalM family protein, partial [Aeromonas sp.]
ANTPIVDTTPNKLVVPVATAATAKAVTATAKPAPAMLGETDAFYQSQIEKAVKVGDIDKAMKLVNEAERAGSTKAKSVFIDAVKRSQK